MRSDAPASATTSTTCHGNDNAGTADAPGRGVAVGIPPFGVNVGVAGDVVIVGIGRDRRCQTAKINSERSW